MSESVVKEGKGEKLVGSPEALIKMMISDSDKRKKVLEEILTEGPKYKQVLNALLLKRMYHLVETIEKNTKTAFILQPGYEVVIEDGKKDHVIPVMMPIHLDKGLDGEKVAEAVSKSPAHEVLTYIMCLQALEWAIRVSDENVK